MSALNDVKASDFKTDVKPVWCPGCGDYGVLAAVHEAMAELGDAARIRYDERGQRFVGHHRQQVVARISRLDRRVQTRSAENIEITSSAHGAMGAVREKILRDLPFPKVDTDRIPRILP